MAPKYYSPKPLGGRGGLERVKDGCKVLIGSGLGGIWLGFSVTGQAC